MDGKANIKVKKKVNRNSYNRESGTEMEKGRQSVGQRTVIAGKEAH